MKKNDSLIKTKIDLFELLGELFIKSISFISFIVIILIFIFVFREAKYTFIQHEQSTTNPEELVQETYGDVPDELGQGNTGYESLETSGHGGVATIDNLLSNEWQPVSANPKYGLIPLAVGSLKVTIIAILFGAPIAILAAIYTSIFANKKLKEIIKPTIEILASFPSVVIGFFALVIMATFFQNLFGYQFRLNAFVGGVALSLAIIPIIYTITDDAINTIPKYWTEASLALGANKWQTAFFVVLPAAIPGIFAALILGFGRAFGETMIVLMATGNAGFTSASPFDPVRTLSATIGAEMAEVIFGEVHYGLLFLIGSILFIFTFTLNAIAEFYIRGKLLKRFRGEV
ncbi:MAG TPA: phosphate ABC transporter permease subunit PstC [Ignavibacteriales bacterium]|nr:phosphate ABC transporter permease subunit PstC [Ignavibacteriales bacterium]HOL81411.1 phosphate ABC transporter permease subunit PstC [Ignavibacteriales bacterium]HOM65525.1 phosphate ABC transporter permease subunit PstC [Ignavibacteriales bacterium]HPP34359.1 phosphate ABC transporter permease subunit PstC [Ignavibacteriales bacterium]HRR18546.1 phosphate ABC transporter permease subunit PstC [Ignavibacteriales bacterium]